MDRRRSRWVGLGCASAVVGAVGLALAALGGLGASVAGLSVAGVGVGTWLLAAIWVAVTTPDPPPSDAGWLAPGATRVVQISGDPAPQVTIGTAVPADAPPSSPGGVVVVFLRTGEAPSAESLAALPRAPVYQVGQVQAGVGEVVALGEAPVAFGSAGGPGAPNLRLGAGGGFVTVLVLDQPTYVQVAADVEATRRECGCEPRVSVAATP
jgi:hypothetical protein